MESNHPLCYELNVVVSDVQKDLLVALLIDAGENNFVEGAIDCDVEFDFDYDHFQRDYYKEIGHNLPLIVYSEDLKYLETLRENILERKDQYQLTLDETAMTIAPIRDQNWRESWKASFKPVDIDGICCILPPWESPDAHAHPYKIVIDPGMAFGTGQHETTRLCLRMYYLLRPTPKAERIFDVGTGSGILAIAAKLHGATEVLGCDIDDKSVEIARENAALNDVAHVEFTTTDISQIAETNFDLVFANIQFKPLVKIFDDLLSHTKKNGDLIISGILASEYEEFKVFLNSKSINVAKVDRLGDWVGILCHRI